MKKIRIILIPLLLAACAEQEMPVPPTPTNPDGRTLIVPNATVSTMEATGNVMSRYNAPSGTTPATRGGTRATTYPYVETGSTKTNIIVTKDADGQVAGANYHYSWLQTPTHTDVDKDINALSARFEVAASDAAKSIPWGETNTGCTAPWRRPTIVELEKIYALNSQLANPLTTVVAGGNTAWYVAATESTGGEGYHLNFNNGRTVSSPKNYNIDVRCVRDAYPYVTTNADGKKSVIVSQDENGTSFAPMHTPWQQTPQHNELSPLNCVSPRFEYGDKCTQANTGVTSAYGEYYWNDAVTACAKYSKNSDKSDLGTWRLPTMKELEISFSHFASGAEWYWSATEASNNSSLAYIHKGYVTTNSKSDDCFVRCVRDFPLPLPPGGEGENYNKPFSVWAYAGTTEPTNWVTEYFKYKHVNATATGFEFNEPQYYPVDGSQKLYFYATAPSYGGGSAGGATTGPRASYFCSSGQIDVMWAKDVRGIAKNSDPALQEQPSFFFRHVMKQVQFKVKADGTFETGKKLTQIKVKNVTTTADVEVITGGVSWRDAKDIPLACDVTLSTTPADAGLVMFRPGASFTLEAVVDGVTYTIPVALTGNKAGEAGTANVVTLTFKRQQVSASATIGAWAATIDGGTVDVE